MKYPFVKQAGVKDCAVASLAMIIRYYKGYISDEQLRDMLETNKDGTSAFNIIKVSEYIGFQSKAIRTNSIGDLKLPCIAYVTIDSKLKHFIVIYEINLKKETILIADPASNIKRMKIKDFMKISNNIYIIFYPIKKIPYLKKYSIFTFIINFFKTNKNSIIKISLISFFINLLLIILSFSFNIFVSSINYDYRLKYIFLIVFISLALFKIVTTHMRNLLTIYLNKKISYELTNEFYQKIIHFPYVYYCNRTTGEIVSRITDLELIKFFMSKIIIILFSNLPLVFISLVVMFNLNLNLTAYTLLFLCIYGIIVVLFRNSFKIKIRNYQLLREKNTSFLVESISAYECIKGLSIENEIIKKFKSLNYNFVDNSLKLSKTINLSNTLKDFINEIFNILIIFLGIIEIEKGVISIGNLITFTFLFSNFLTPIKDVLDSSSEFEESIGALKRALELDYKISNSGRIEKIEKTNIIVKNLNYSYNENQILKNINLKIKEGEKVILVGESGGGKSTLLKILKNYLKVKNGEVFIGDIDINNYNNKAFSDISYIAQNEFLFTDSMYENITLYRDVNPKKIVESSSICYADKIIKNDFGLNMMIEENGFNLSGGERQRIILARTILSNSKILLIDEGTNQLDISLERTVLKNIFNKFKEKTVIVISHRLDNMDLFDHFIRIEGGYIKEDVIYRK